MKKSTENYPGASSSHQAVSFRLSARGKRAWKWLALVALALVFAACQPGGASNAHTAAVAPSQATVQVPQGYHGLILVTFTPATTYDQALAIIQQAGLYLPAECTGPGRLPLSPIETPLPPKDQRASFAQNHQLIAAGKTGHPPLKSAFLVHMRRCYWNL
jgi:hypothetical protein